MNKEQSVITNSILVQLQKSLEILKTSFETVDNYDSHKNYTPKEREPYDALSDRFVRAVEISIKFFKSYEKYLYAENSETLRDLLGKMEKLKMVSSTELWIRMRDIRNRIVHEYLPDDLKEIYDLILGIYKNEFNSLSDNIKNISVT